MLAYLNYIINYSYLECKIKFIKTSVKSISFFAEKTDARSKLL